MKKLLAILTVMTMVLTTLIVPTVAFGVNEGETLTPTLNSVDVLKDGQSINNGGSAELGEEITFKAEISNYESFTGYAHIELYGVIAGEEGGEYETGVNLIDEKLVGEEEVRDGVFEATFAFSEEEYDFPAGEWCVKSITLFDEDDNEYTVEIDGVEFLVGITEPIAFEYDVTFQVSVEYDEEYPYTYRVTSGKETSIAAMKATVGESFVVPTVEDVTVGEETAEFLGWYYNDGENHCVSVDDTIKVTGNYDIYFSPYFSKLVVETYVGYLDVDGNSCQDNIVILLDEGSTINDLLEEVNSLYADKHSENAAFTNWAFDAEEINMEDVITPDRNWFGLTAIYEEGEVNYDEIYGDDEGDSNSMTFFVFGSDNGMITYEWEEDGDTYSETWQSAMWFFEADKTLESVWGQGDGSKITAVTKENSIFKGWKLYTGEDFTFEFVEAGGEINKTDGVIKTYTETYYFDEEWEDNDGEMRPEGYYDEYLAIVGQHEVEEDVIYDISDLLSFVPENNIYFAVAQWDEVDLKTESIEDADPEEIVKMVSDDIKDIIASESDTEELSAEAIVEWIKETLAAAVNELIESEDSILTEDAKTTSYEITVVDADGFKVDNQDIPEEGVAITVPYPEEINKDNCDEYEFVILHMISEGNKAGEIEELDVIGITEDGLLVKVNSLSSFVVAYQEAPDDSQGGNGSGTAPGTTTPGNSGTNTPAGGATSGTTATPDKAVDTGDNFNMAPFIAVMAIALAGVAAAMFRRRTVK